MAGAAFPLLQFFGCLFLVVSETIWLLFLRFHGVAAPQNRAVILGGHLFVARQLSSAVDFARCLDVCVMCFALYGVTVLCLRRFVFGNVMF